MSDAQTQTIPIPAKRKCKVTMQITTGTQSNPALQTRVPPSESCVTPATAISVHPWPSAQTSLLHAPTTALPSAQTNVSASAQLTRTMETPSSAPLPPRDVSEIQTRVQHKKSQARKDRTLIIGSSILKSIIPRRLFKTDIQTLRGAKINSITERIMNTDLTKYNQIIILVGGNDASDGRSLSQIRTDFESLLYAARYCSPDTCKIIISGLPPRVDTRVKEINDLIIDLCEDFNLQYIPQYTSFFLQNQDINLSLYHRDKIHLSGKGTSQLLRNINMYAPIFRHYNEEYCFYCGETGHMTQVCHHGKQIECFRCHKFGHKQRLCQSMYYTY